MQPSLPELSEDFEMHVQPKKVLGRRWDEEGGREELLLKREGQPNIDATWVEKKALEEQFPHFHL